MFVDTLWPDFDEKELDSAVDEFQNREESMEMPEEIFDKVVKIAQSRGFVFNASSIYGGLRSSYERV